MTDHAQKVLLALTERTSAEDFAKFLGEKGFETFVASDGAIAMETALRETPALIILDLYLPVINGERLFQILKNNPTTSKVPFIFLAESRKEVKGFRIGIDRFAVKPFQMEEIYGNIKQIISSGGYLLGDKDFQGRLAGVHLADILQMLQLNRKEGELLVTTDTASGMICVKDGQVFNATANGAEREKAFFRILSWKDGMFEFRPTRITAPRKLALSTANLIMEGTRQMDEYENSRHLFPSDKSALRVRVDVSQIPEGLKPVMLEVLNLVRHYPRVKDLVDHCAFPDFEVYTTLAGLLKRQVLEEAKETEREDETSGGLLPPVQAIKVKEKLINRWSDMLGVNFGKVLVASTSTPLTERFVEACKDLPGFLASPRIIPAGWSSEKVLGELGSLRLYGGTDFILFAIPALKGMAPLIKAVSSNTVGLILLWDEEGEANIPDLISARAELLSRRRVPLVYAYAGKEELDRDRVRGYRKMFNLKQDDPVFSLSSPREDNAPEVFRHYFAALLKEDYISGRRGGV